MDYDLIIVGCGPAGMSAGLYAARLGLKTVMFEAKEYGGAMATAHIIENYPGFERISGKELTEKMLNQAKKAGADTIHEGVLAISKEGDGFTVTTNRNNQYAAKAIILATGGEYKKLGIEGEEKYFGKGVSYCPKCDGPLFRDKNVAVIGGGNTATEGAIYLSEIAKNIYVVHRRDEFTADAKNVEGMKELPNVQVFLSYVPTEISGNETVSKLKIQSLKTNETKDLVVDGVFVCVGEIPITKLASSIGVELDEKQAIKVDEKMQTNVSGIFAAGDVTGRVKQIISATGQGTEAAVNAFRYIKSIKGPRMPVSEEKMKKI